MTEPLPIEPYEIHVGDEVLDDLRDRIGRTRWPSESPAKTWQQGTDLTYLREVLAYWADDFDWRAQERELNRYAHFRAEVDGVWIHFVHQRARGGDGVPLILSHGWPSSFVEMLALVPLLTDPEAHGVAGPAFDVVIPSLPGYGFSERPHRTGVTTRHTAAMWHQLMGGLGYNRYGAMGGDFGAAVSTYLALDHPESLLGLHLTNIDNEPYTGPGSRPLSEAETAYLAQFQQWRDTDRGYGAIQSTRPQTLSYGLNDSPAGLAAWILEKWRAWGDTEGDIESSFDRDFLLTVVTIYWATQTIGTSIRDYVDNRWFIEPLGPDDSVTVPTGIAVFANQFVDDGSPPREWAERLYNVVRWTQMATGAHFAAVEEPELVAHDLAAFFAAL